MTLSQLEVERRDWMSHVSSFVSLLASVRSQPLLPWPSFAKNKSKMPIAGQIYWRNSTTIEELFHKNQKTFLPKMNKTFVKNNSTQFLLQAFTHSSPLV